MAGGGGVSPSGRRGASGIHGLACERLIGIERGKLALSVVNAEDRIGLVAPDRLDLAGGVIGGECDVCIRSLRVCWIGGIRGVHFDGAAEHVVFNGGGTGALGGGQRGARLRITCVGGGTGAGIGDGEESLEGVVKIGCGGDRGGRSRSIVRGLGGIAGRVRSGGLDGFGAIREDGCDGGRAWAGPVGDGASGGGDGAG